jgi:hypothetical protein
MKKRFMFFVVVGLSITPPVFAISQAERALMLPHTGEMKLSETPGASAHCEAMDLKKAGEWVDDQGSNAGATTAISALE